MENKEKEIVIKENNNNLQAVTKELLVKYLQAFNYASQLTKEETEQFIEIASAYQLNPFKREIHCIPYEDKNGKRSLSIIVGYETYLKRAERSGKLAGWKVWTEGKIQDRTLKAICEVYRKDWTTSLRHEVYYSEYFRPTRIWQEKPYTMIKKIAIAQSFRLAFPDELGGMPYTQEEQWEEKVIDITQGAVKSDTDQKIPETKTEKIETEPNEQAENQKVENPNPDDYLKSKAEKLKGKAYQILEIGNINNLKIESKKNKKSGKDYLVLHIGEDEKSYFIFDTEVASRIEDAINGNVSPFFLYNIEEERNGKIYNHIVFAGNEDQHKAMNELVFPF